MKRFALFGLIVLLSFAGLVLADDILNPTLGVKRDVSGSTVAATNTVTVANGFTGSITNTVTTTGGANNSTNVQLGTSTANIGTVNGSTITVTNAPNVVINNGFTGSITNSLTLPSVTLNNGFQSSVTNAVTIANGFTGSITNTIATSGGASNSTNLQLGAATANVGTVNGSTISVTNTIATSGGASNSTNVNVNANITNIGGGYIWVGETNFVGATETNLTAFYKFVQTNVPSVVINNGFTGSITNSLTLPNVTLNNGFSSSVTNTLTLPNVTLNNGFQSSVTNSVQLLSGFSSTVTNTVSDNIIQVGSSAIGSGGVPVTNGASVFLVSQQPIATGGASVFHLLTLASTNTNVVKGSAGTLYSFSAWNTNSVPYWVALFDLASQPVTNSTRKMVFLVPANGTALNGAGNNPVIPACGIAFANGIAVATSANPIETNLVAITANEGFDVGYK